MATTLHNRPVLVGTRVNAHYELTESNGRGGKLIFDRCVPGTLERVRRISPTVFEYHVKGDDGLLYKIPSQIGDIEPVSA